MRISEVSARTGLPTTTLRFYESMGLLAPTREPNGYRTYDEASVAQVALIEAAKQLALSLPEIADLLAVVSADSCTAARGVLHHTLVDHLQELDTRLVGLNDLRDRIASATERVSRCPDSQDACRTECVFYQLPVDPQA